MQVVSPAPERKHTAPLPDFTRYKMGYIERALLGNTKTRAAELDSCWNDGKMAERLMAFMVLNGGRQL